MQAVSDGRKALWPSRPLVSSRREIGEGAVSPQERAQLGFLIGPVCDPCGLTQEADLGPLALCAACIAKPPKWSSARAALAYDEASRRIVLDLKRAGRRDGLETMAGWMVQAGRPLIERADLIVPAPLHSRRLASRGLSQSGWLAASVCPSSGVPVRVNMLNRGKATPSQVGLSPKAHHRNLAGTFSVREGEQARWPASRFCSSMTC